MKSKVHVTLFCSLLMIVTSYASVEDARVEIQPNPSIDVSDFKLKVIDPCPGILSSAASGIAETFGKKQHADNATIQWRCRLTNKTQAPLGYRLSIEFCDADNFVLDSVSTETLGILEVLTAKDINPGETVSRWNEKKIDCGRCKNIAICRIKIQVLKTRAEVEAEADAKAAKWKKLYVGMTKERASQILGRPASVSTYSIINSEIWIYASGGHVEFENNRVSSWEAPLRDLF